MLKLLLGGTDEDMKMYEGFILLKFLSSSCVVTSTSWPIVAIIEKVGKALSTHREDFVDGIHRRSLA